LALTYEDAADGRRIILANTEDVLRVLGIVGSPRRGGNTDVLVTEVLAGAAAAGAEVEKVVLTDLKIAPCSACDACRGAGQCVMEDDMSDLVGRMARSDVWVLGTPVYWWGPTAQFKAFLDRWYAFDQERELFRNRRVIFVIPSGGGDRYARHTAGILEDVANYLDMDHRETILAGGTGSPGAVSKRGDLMDRASRAGRHAVTSA
jgi:multimeric flavodoxin WrbA